MKCKVFNIRLQKLGAATDEENLNEFLKKNTVINNYATLVHGSSTFWSILLFYEENHDTGKQYTDGATQPLITHDKDIVANLEKIKSN